MTREEVKKILINGIKSQMKRDKKTLADIAVISPKKGKDFWTFKEYLEAIEEDKPLEDSEDMNPIDSYLRYLEYKEKNKSSLK